MTAHMTAALCDRSKKGRREPTDKQRCDWLQSAEKPDAQGKRDGEGEEKKKRFRTECGVETSLVNKWRLVTVTASMASIYPRCSVERAHLWIENNSYSARSSVMMMMTMFGESKHYARRI